MTTVDSHNRFTSQHRLSDQVSANTYYAITVNGVFTYFLTGLHIQQITPTGATMMQPCASAAGFRDGGPVLQSGTVAML